MIRLNKPEMLYYLEQIEENVSNIISNLIWHVLWKN